jgi:hypothetical protein
MASIAARSRRKSLVIAAATGLQLAAICAATAAHESEAMRANRAAAAISGIARNTFERDCLAALEANLAAGMNHLNWLGKQASAMEAARAEANREAGS